MKKLIFSIIILLLSTYCVGQTSEFPLGVYIASGDTATRFADGDYQGIKDLGVNLVIQFTSNNPDNKDSLATFDQVIALNADTTTDYIHHYTAGYYSKWEAEETAKENNTPGFKSNTITTGIILSSYKKAQLDVSTPDKYLLWGPDYNQDRKYKLLYGEFDQRVIHYKVNFRLKIDGNTTQADDVCIISVRYTTRDGNNVTIKQDTLQANKLFNQFTDHTLEYSLPETIQGTKVDTTHAPEFSVRNDGDIVGSTESYQGAYGVQFNIQWLGNRTLYVDYIEVYDSKIGVNFSKGIFIQDLAEECSTYAADFSNWSNIKYWYSLDEPHSIDNYEPYRIVDSILTVVSNTRLITAFYPEWNGKRNNENAMGDFVSRTKPNKTMLYYYPYWPGADKYNHDGLYGQKTVLQAPYLSND